MGLGSVGGPLLSGPAVRLGALEVPDAAQVQQGPGLVHFGVEHINLTFFPVLLIRSSRPRRGTRSVKLSSFSGR